MVNGIHRYNGFNIRIELRKMEKINIVLKLFAFAALILLLTLPLLSYSQI